MSNNNKSCESESQSINFVKSDLIRIMQQIEAKNPKKAEQLGRIIGRLEAFQWGLK